MIEPAQGDIKRRVVYRPNRDNDTGYITAFTEKYVFVRYDKHAGETSVPTLREDLEWID